MSTPTLTNADASMARFEKQTTRYGSITMTAGLLFSLLGPAYLVLFTDLEISPAMIWVAFAAVAATFGVFWFVEPLTYFPILGSAAMYQAFMIGNISNKLLPAAIVAQSSIDAKPGTRRGDLAAVMAICGAATVHLTSLLVFVGFFGSWMISVIPTEMIEVARIYILPSLMGAVLVQAIVAMKQPRPTLIAILLSLIMYFAVIPLVPSLALFATALVVVSSIIFSWIFRNRRTVHASPED
ncbi:hypothetical protein CQ010_15655 [Arthrobacter sp. MYb211]|uniref:hypothetical protein n=1 Tax=unclassified Arthrobacter TaxID=235627 RepID=UPI000CFAB619|nr:MULTISPECIES: hypothetical protein [unclassified Arthrobacter]PQZ98040.1 hypothetical protein CQ019_17590 [Arthrobacter sp. MYb229]PRA10030.1 hypothetical protein CQ015_15640 [Arthrobacter sp. MYb221]PRB46922.1 hypothetical protein CQ013_17615 [Arthrobacter sp. MYb216]PRC05222.1 hypothetical protein CQ010_15655 [Arthrobacter sp. MYb211]